MYSVINVKLVVMYYIDVTYFKLVVMVFIDVMC